MGTGSRAPGSRRESRPLEAKVPARRPLRVERSGTPRAEPARVPAAGFGSFRGGSGRGTVLRQADRRPRDPPSSGGRVECASSRRGREHALRAGRRRSRWPPRTDPPRPARGPRSGRPRQEPVSARGRASELRSARQPLSGGRAFPDRERESATGSSGGGSEPNARVRAARRACPPGRARVRTTCGSGANGSVRRRRPGHGH